MKMRFVNAQLVVAMVFQLCLLSAAQDDNLIKPKANPDVAKTTAAQTGPSGIITTVAGTGYMGDSGNGGPAIDADLLSPMKVAVDSAGNLYIPDQYMNVIRKVTASTGKISIYAGTFGVGGYSGDNGPATSAKLDEPNDVAVDSLGNLYISDLQSQVVRRVAAKTGIITTVAGNGVGANRGTGSPPSFCLPFTPGKATETELCYPISVAVDSDDNLYIGDMDRVQVYRVSKSTGDISVAAGDGIAEYSGDGGLAINAGIAGPYGLAVDRSGNLYIADSGSCAIRKVSASTKLISSLVGIPNPEGFPSLCGLTGDGGPANKAEVNFTEGIAVDAEGDVYIADTGNRRVRIIAASNGRIYTVAGTYEPSRNEYFNFGYSGDGGPAAYAGLFFPTGVAADALGNLYISDAGNNVIRRVALADAELAGAPTIAPSDGLISAPTRVTLAGPKGATIRYTANGSIPTTSSTEYSGPISVGKTEVITAFATVPGHPNTPATIAEYFYAPAPVFSPEGESFSSSVKVTLANANPSAQIYYTTNNSNISGLGPGVKKYTGPIMLDATTTLSAAAWTFAHDFAGNVVSAWGPVTTETYTLSKAASKNANSTFDTK